MTNRSDPRAGVQACQFRRHEHLVRAHANCGSIYRIEDGWACRYSLLGSGRRQITALYLPGEYCEPHWLFERCSRDPVMALTSLRAISIPIQPGDPIVDQSGDARKLLMAMIKLLNRQADWIASLGRKTAIERLCSVLSDVFERLQLVGRATCDACPMPLTQADLADVVGLTPVHVNRVLKQLRARGLLEVRGKRMTIADPVLLHRIGAAKASGSSDPTGTRKHRSTPMPLLETT